MSAEAASLSSSIPKSMSSSKSEFPKDVKALVDMLSKLNPFAKEFFPSSYGCNGDKYQDQLFQSNLLQPNKSSESGGYPNGGKHRNRYSQGRRRLYGRPLKAIREDSIKRTVYVSDIDQHVTEEHLAALFSNCGQVVDCRICGDPHSALRFAFVEFSDEYGARVALNLGGAILGYYPVRVLPSKTAILPVNPSYLPQTEDEREMCTRTVYCTNIDSRVSEAEVRNFFQNACGEVSRLRLLGDEAHSTRIAFVEFVLAESAIVALSCSGLVLGTQPVRVSPSKTPVRVRIPRPTLH